MFATKRRQIIAATVALMLVWSTTGVVAQTPDLAQRSVTIGSSEPLTTTTYDVRFDLPGIDMLGSISILFCENSPLPEDGCTPPSGFDASSAILTNQSGETGFTIDGSSTANHIILSRTALPNVATTVNYDFENIINPQTANKSYYARIATYASEDASGAPTARGSVALSTTEQLNVTLYIPPYLEFCVGISIVSQDCQTANGNQLSVGSLTIDQAATGISKFLAATNAPGGYTVQVSGSTMASGNNVITRLSSPTSSSPGTKQFGLNLRANNEPDVGLEPSGPGSAQPTTAYNQTDKFTFNSGDAVANSSTSNDRVTFTVSYIVNIDDQLPPGQYTSTLTYICTGSF